MAWGSNRRTFAVLLAGVGLSGAITSPAAADEKVIRIGYQKYGTLILLKDKVFWNRSWSRLATRSSGRSFQPDRSSWKR